MTTSPRRAVALLVGLLLCGGCVGRSDPARFYVLAGAASRTTPAASVERDQGSPLGVGPITLPRYLERINIVTRRESELEVAEFDRWGEPLSEGVPRAIASHLAARLETQRVFVFPWPAGTAFDRQVLIDVSRFDGTLGDSVLLEARWRVLGADRKELLLRSSTVREPVRESGYPGLVAAMSRCIGVLSEEVAAAIKGLPPRQAGGGQLTR